MQTLADLLAELKRRRVFRVAAVYAGVAFIIIQIVDGAFDYLRIPEWVGTTVIVLVLLGFPIAIGLAWAFDITDKGIVHTRGKAQAPATSRRPILTNWTLGIVAALAIIAAAWSWLREPCFQPTKQLCKPPPGVVNCRSNAVILQVALRFSTRTTGLSRR